MSDVQAAGAADAGERQSASPDTEATARRMGWRPETEFQGDKSKWIDADAFIAKVQDEVPVLKRTLRNMDEKFAKQERELGEVKQVLTDFREFASRGEQRAYERARAELMAQRQVAVASADTEAFAKVDAQIAELDKDAVKATTAKPETKTEKPAAQQQQEPPREITDWIKDNEWFNSDAVLHEVAKAIDNDLRKEKPGMPIGERLALVKTEVQTRFPEKFTNGRREAPGAVITPGGSTPRAKKGKTYDDLPPEAKRACDKYVKTIPPDKNGKKFTREDYVRDYDWSGE